MSKRQADGDEAIKRRLGIAFGAALRLWCVSADELALDLKIDVREIEAIVSGNVTPFELQWLIGIYDYLAVHLDAPVIGSGDVALTLPRIEAWLRQFPQSGKENSPRDDPSSR